MIKELFRLIPQRGELRARERGGDSRLHPDGRPLLHRRRLPGGLRGLPLPRAARPAPQELAALRALRPNLLRLAGIVTLLCEYIPAAKSQLPMDHVIMY